MKQKLLSAFLLSFLFSLHFAAAQNIHRHNNAPKPKWIAKNPFEQKVFIENKGQYEITGKAATKDILYGAHMGGLQYYFTPNGIIISKSVSVKRSEKEIEEHEQKEGEKEDGDNDDNSWQYKRVEQFSEMNFEGANPRTALTTDNEVSWYYNYTLKGNIDIQAHAWKKLTYHDLYPGIDMQFYFPDDKDARLNDSTVGRSFEYSFIVHSGADISQIKIKYNGDVIVNTDGTIAVKSAYGNFTEYTPAAKLLSSNEAINCGFSLSNGVIKFNAENYDKNETLLVDPLVITPPTYNGTNAAYDVDWDDAGNIYAYGGDYPWEILKYNDKGTLLWSFSTTIRNNEYIGDFAVDRSSQSVYVTEGVDISGAEIIKLNQAGSQFATYTGNVDFNEMWKIAFSTCSNQAVVAGGGNTTPSYTASYIDTNLTNLNLVNTLNDQISGYHDMWSLAIDDFGNAYMITAHSHSTIDPSSFDNVLLKLPLPSLSPTTWLVSSHYNYLEIASMTYGYNYTNSAPSNGYNGMAISDTTLYTYDSYIIKKWGTYAGKLLDSIFVNGATKDNNSISWGGITVDDCGNVFVGSHDSVKQYNYNLNYVTSYVEPGTVYDVKLSLSDTLYASGVGFITDTAISLPPCHIIKAVNTIKDVTCDSLGSAVISNLSGGTAPYTIVWNTTPVITGGSATELKKGTYIATITDSSCPRQIYADTIKILGPLRLQLSSNTDTFCLGTPVTITVTNGSNYKWSPSTGLNTTAGSSVIANPTVTTTYSVIGTVSAGGCLDTENVVINIHPLPTLNIKPPLPSICIGQSVTLTASGAFSYLWNPSTGLSSDTLSTVKANPTVTTTYTLYGTSSFGCADSQNIVLQVNPIPIVNVSPPSTTICDGKSAPLTANGATTYQWSPSTGLSSTSGSLITATPSITTTYTTIGTSLGCSDTTTIAIRVVQDSLKVSTNNTSVCQGNSAVITASGAYSYNWTPSTGLNKSTGDTVTATPLSTTTYTLFATGAVGCPDTEKVVVDVNLPPVLTIAPAKPQICIGQSVGLSVSGATTYHWSPSTGLNQTIGSGVTANPTVTTTYTAYGTDASGCNDSTKVVLKVNPLPIITIAPPDSTICHGRSTSLTASGASTYQWSPSFGLNSTTNSTVTANPSTTTTYRVNGTDTLGCIDSTNVTITVIQNNIKVTPNTTAVCQGNSVVITASGGTVYNWTPSTGLNKTAGDTITASPLSTTSYTLFATGNGGCPDTNKVVVNVNLPPTLNILPTTPQICFGHPTPLTVSGASTYHWSPSSGLAQTTGSTVTANPTVTTTYTAYGTDTSGCNDSTKVVLKVNPLPLVTLVPTDTLICHGLSVTLTASGTSTYQWSPSTALSSTTNSTVVADPTITTTYTVYGTDLLGCVDTVSSVVNIIPNSIKLALDPTNAIICLGDTATISASGGTNYSWSPSVALSAITGDTVRANPTISTSYSVIGVGIGGCADTSRVYIAVSPPPVIIVQPQAPVICDGQAILLTASGASLYNWSPSTGLYETVGSTIDAHPTTTTTYTVHGTDSLGCIDSTKFTLDVNIAPIDSFTISIPSICYPLQIQFSNVTKNGVSYFWNFGDGSTSADQNPLHIYALPGTYTVTLIATSADGCTDTVSKAETLSNYNADVYIPNSFTPSVPGVNQKFRSNVECIAPTNYDFRIYDRWGMLMYETNDPSAGGWDGTYKGKQQPLDVYVYYIQLTCGTCNFFKKGNVTLLR